MVYNYQRMLFYRVCKKEPHHFNRAVFVRFSLGGGQSFDWRLATIAGMEAAKLVPWNSLLK